jgi:hypothetical protein
VIHYEHVTRVGPLGVRFWDAVSDRPVAAGLRVSATPVGGGRVTPAGPPHGDVYTLLGLPGLEESERGAGDDAYWAAVPVVRRFRVDVDDADGRFLPTAFEVTLPHRRVFTDPEPTGRGVPMFSTPARPVPGSLAVARALLWDVRANSPAAWALLEVGLGTTILGRGVAGNDGQIAVIFAWPKLPNTVAPPPLLSAQTWAVTLRLLYARVAEPDERPLLDEVLGQAQGVLLDDDTPEKPFTPPPLRYGTELLLASSTSTEHRLLCRPNP